MIKKYRQVRFFLFCSSYSGKTIVSFLKKKYSNKKLLEAVKRLSQVLGFNYGELERFIVLEKSPNRPYKRTPYNLRIYLETERELTKLVEERLDEYSTTKEDYQNQLLYPAIERAVGNLLADIDNDTEFQGLFNEKTKSATYIYYKVAYKYKLPTIRIVPFILRLIS